MHPQLDVEHTSRRTFQQGGRDAEARPSARSSPLANGIRFHISQWSPVTNTASVTRGTAVMRLSAVGGRTRTKSVTPPAATTTTIDRV